MTATPAVSTVHLTKRYGELTALDGVNLSVPRGAVYGFVGRNGAGKTTAIRLLLGLTRPSSGEASVLSGHIEDLAVRARVGYLPDVPGFYDWMTPEETMSFAARLHQLPGGLAETRSRDLLAMVGLDGVTRPVGGFSRGMRQRLGLARSLINAPDLLILDEPTSALDPLGRRDVLEMISALRGATTVIFSTHLLADVEHLCDHVGILSGGRLLAQGPIDTIAPDRRWLRVRVRGGEELAEVISDSPWCENLTVTRHPAGTEFVIAGDLDSARIALPRIVAERGLSLDHLAEEKPSLEDAFIEVTS